MTAKTTYGPADGLSPSVLVGEARLLDQWRRWWRSMLERGLARWDLTRCTCRWRPTRRLKVTMCPSVGGSSNVWVSADDPLLMAAACNWSQVEGMASSGRT